TAGVYAGRARVGRWLKHEVIARDRIGIGPGCRVFLASSAMNTALPPIAPEAEITGRTLLFPVVGHPVAQVKAPVAFNALFRAAGVDARVVPLDLPPESVVASCRALLASESVGGILVTVPYKKTLFALVEE